MERHKIKIFVLALAGLSVLVLGNLGLYQMVDESGSIILSILFFAIIYAVLVGVLFLVYREVDRKNEDVERSRRQYYYSKPYIFRIDNNGNVKMYNKTIEENLDNYLVYKNVTDFELVEDNLNILDDIQRQITFIVKFRDIDRDEQFIRFTPITTSRGYYLIGEDITEEYSMNLFHRTMALYNEVTKLPNKNYLGIYLQQLLDNRIEKEKKNVLVSLEFSGFRNIEKLFGSKVSKDTLLKLTELIDESLGGFKYILFNGVEDNFLVLFKDVKNYNDVVNWLSDFSNVFDRAIDVKGNMFTIGLKAGVFNIEVEKYQKLTVVDVYENVQLALRKAKESRRMSYSVYDVTLGRTFSREQLMEVDLASAIMKKEFAIYLQPQLRKTTDKIVGFEALIRWKNPKYAYESPATFIEIAEKNNLIVEIGRYIIEETFKIAKELEKNNIRIAINISPVQLLQTGFVNDIVNSYVSHQLQPGSVSLEITETFLMESLEEIIEKLTILKKRGLNIHLDNFGSGYSSMLYLKDLPIDGISISREFIKSVATDESQQKIVKQIINLANSLDLEVIAEGIEEGAQGKFLEAQGCDLFQGYLISKPLPKDEAIKFMLEYNKNK